MRYKKVLLANWSAGLFYWQKQILLEFVVLKRKIS